MVKTRLSNNVIKLVIKPYIKLSLSCLYINVFIYIYIYI